MLSLGRCHSGPFVSGHLEVIISRPKRSILFEIYRASGIADCTPRDGIGSRVLLVVYGTPGAVTMAMVFVEMMGKVRIAVIS